MKAKFTLLFSLLLLAFLSKAQKDLSIDYMLRGYLYAESSINDSLAPGGFGGSNNSAKQISDQTLFNEQGLFMKIDVSQKTVFGGEYMGYSLYIVNKSDSIVKFSASDSRLYAVAEVFLGGKWQDIEYLPSSWCGNSYHHVYLKPNEYWLFSIPKFKGEHEVKLRYKLKINKNDYLYSNEIIAHINRGQLSNKRNYNPDGLMDPYND